MENKNFDIAIIGAGPAGSSAALTLQKSNCSVALFEKAEFPRNKICGDGVCDRSINTLKAINPAYLEEFLAKIKSLCVHNTELVYKGRSYVIDFKSFGYTCRRRDFDNFLFSLVQRDCKNVSVFQNCGIKSVERVSDGMRLTADNGDVFNAKMVLVCNGASSKIARELTGTTFDKNKTGVAVRAYYSGVKGLNNNTIELHYKKEYFPGYLWVFPMADGTANVGFGCHLKENSIGDADIREVFQKWIDEDPVLKERFAEAVPEGSVQGGLVPYNSNEFNCYGDNFCICGDAANLIDPISGGGIGSAMVSGYFAAQQAEKCILQNDCSKKATEEYAKTLKKRVEREMRVRYSIQKIVARHTWLLDVLAFVGKQNRILEKIKNWYF
ncbi:MAG: NAD(P)/FAD-dependent oxidoreductase [Bacteroidales bacterium]|nr:NAD(P)/FAD-dependent oxidoreductase [Bacteroidales bacterium]